MGQKAKNAGNKKQSKTKPVDNDIDLKTLEELMGSCLSTTVRIPKQDHIIKELKKQKCDFIKTCQNETCGKKYTKDTKQNFKLCSKCKTAYYCCKECQKEDWCNHKKDCGFIGVKASEVPSVNKDCLTSLNIHKNFKKDTMLNQIGMYWLCNSQDEDSYYFKTIKQEEFENKYLKYINNTGDAIAHYREEIKKRSLYVIELVETFIIG